jgi:hypothetical protein
MVDVDLFRNLSSFSTPSARWQHHEYQGIYGRHRLVQKQKYCWECVWSGHRPKHISCCSNQTNNFQIQTTVLVSLCLSVFILFPPQIYSFWTIYINIAMLQPLNVWVWICETSGVMSPFVAPFALRRLTISTLLRHPINLTEGKAIWLAASVRDIDLFR